MSEGRQPKYVGDEGMVIKIEGVKRGVGEDGVGVDVEDLGDMTSEEWREYVY